MELCERGLKETDGVVTYLIAMQQQRCVLKVPLTGSMTMI